MPLNPPSYKGQDVWYSPNVYINKVPAALWLPPKIGDALIFQFTLPPDETQQKYDSSVSNFYYDNTYAENAADPTNKDALVVAGDKVGQTIDTVEAEAPAPGATSDKLQGTPESTPSPLQLPPGASPWKTLDANLEAALAEAKQGKWTDTSDNTKACFAELGQSQNFYDAKGRPNPWCAAFVGAMLKRSGIEYVKNNLWSRGFSAARWGKPLALNDYESWRYNDLVEFSWGHVAFIRGIDVKRGKVQVIGGNQSNTVNQVNYNALKKVVYCARNWVVPPEVDKPIITDLSGGKVSSPAETR